MLNSESFSNERFTDGATQTAEYAVQLFALIFSSLNLEPKDGIKYFIKAALSGSYITEQDLEEVNNYVVESNTATDDGKFSALDILTALLLKAVDKSEVSKESLKPKGRVN